MADNSLSRVLQRIRMLAAVQAYRNLADVELLARFVEANDESAFTVVIERYGSMVMGLCCRALGNVHDAEDVCQATFLVLAHKAGSIHKGTSLSTWLHGVACRMAGRLKRDKMRRQRHERKVASPLAKDTATEVTWRECQAILDEELERLPQRYRSPLILCYLAGKTRDEAARQLRVSTGSLHGRLQRGRDLLRQRLTRRGLTLSPALFATVLGECTAHAGLAPIRVVASAKAALAIVENQPITQGVISKLVLDLTREALKSMFIAKLKLGTAAALVCLVAIITCRSLTSTGAAQDLFPPAKALIGPARKPSTSRAESDAEFIRRVSLDLRGTEPTPTEVHFFITSKDSDRREKLVDLMIQERQTRKHVDVDVQGTLVPIKRMWVFAPAEGQIEEIPPSVKAGGPVFKNQDLLFMYDKGLAEKIAQLRGEINSADWVIKHSQGRDRTAVKEIDEANLVRASKAALLADLLERTNSIVNRPGHFAVRSPINGTLLSLNHESLLNRFVKPHESLLRVGAVDAKNPKSSEWEVELRIPQEQIGQVLQAFGKNGFDDELDVDLVLATVPTKTFRGKLKNAKIALRADAQNEVEPVVLAWVRISGSDIPQADQVPAWTLLIGTKVRARIRSRADEK
jgi:RNA polymerase sigma factor (sigma-70 family)